MDAPDEATSSLTLRGIPRRVRDKLAARARAKHQSLNSYMIDLLSQEADTPTMAEVLADVEDLRRRPTGLSGDDAVAAVRAARDAQDDKWA